MDGRARTLDGKAQTLAQQEYQLHQQSTGLLTRAEQQRLIAQLDQQQQAISAERQQLEGLRESIQEQQRALPQQQETFETYRIRHDQQKLVQRYLDLLNELIDNSSDVRWSAEEVDDYLDRAETLLYKVRHCCKANRIDERRLLLYRGLLRLLDQVEAAQNEQTSGLFASSSVTFDYDVDERAALNAYRISGFTDESAQAARAEIVPISPEQVEYYRTLATDD